MASVKCQFAEVILFYFILVVGCFAVSVRDTFPKQTIVGVGLYLPVFMSRVAIVYAIL